MFDTIEETLTTVGINDPDLAVLLTLALDEVGID